VKQSPEAQLERYRVLLNKYHPSLDLLSDQALADLDAHLADARSYADLIRAFQPSPSPLLDLGSGNGLPGIPLAIYMPDVDVHLVERRRRRARFLQLVVGQLRLFNVTVHACDVQALRLQPVKVVTAQAVGDLLTVYCLTAHLHAAEVVLVVRTDDRWHRALTRLKTSLRPPFIAYQTRRREAHGRLVAVQITGGLSCRS
jgi:16S rRNA (guanine(527)-N(7))-methyltransferase RsmG